MKSSECGPNRFGWKTGKVSCVKIVFLLPRTPRFCFSLRKLTMTSQCEYYLSSEMIIDTQKLNYNYFMNCKLNNLVSCNLVFKCNCNLEKIKAG